MAKYDEFTSLEHPGRPVLVEAAKRDGDGKNIVNNYVRHNTYDGTLKVGEADVADNLSTDKGAEESYSALQLAQIAAAISDGSYAKVSKIIGNTMVWYNGIENGNFTDGTSGSISGWNTNNVSVAYQNGMVKITATSRWGGIKQNGLKLVSGHKYLIYFDYILESGVNSDCVLEINNGASSNWIPTHSATGRQSLRYLWDPSNTTDSAYIYMYTNTESGWGYFCLGNVMLIDVTLVLQGADVSSASDSRLKKYIEYGISHAGRVLGKLVLSELTMLTSRGFNLYAGQTFPAYSYDWYVNHDFAHALNPTRLHAGFTYYIGGTNASDPREALRIRVFDLNGNIISSGVSFGGYPSVYYADAEYTFKGNYASAYTALTITVSVDCYIDIVTPTVTNDPCINVSNASLNGTYEPYHSDSKPISVGVLRSAGTAHDEVEQGEDKAVKTNNIGTYTFTGNETLDAIAEHIYRFQGILSSNPSKQYTTSDTDVTCVTDMGKLVGSGVAQVLNVSSGNGLIVASGADILFHSDSISTSAEFAGKSIFYELATPTTEDLPSLPENLQCWNNGSIEATYDSSNDCPAGVDMLYQIDIKSFIEGVGDREDVNWTPEALVSQEQLAQTEAEIADIESGAQPVGKALFADNLTPYSDERGSVQEEPFISQGTATDNGTAIVTVAGLGQLKEKQGNSVVKNQLCVTPLNASSSYLYANGCSLTYDSSTELFSMTASQQNADTNTYPHRISIISGHKYLYAVNIKTSSPSVCIYMGSASRNAYAKGNNSWETLISINNGEVSYISIRDERASGWDTIQFRKDMVQIDLTQWFNGNANIPQDLLDHPENAGRYGLLGLAYNAGTLENSDGVTLVCTGRNLIDQSKIHIGNITAQGEENNTNLKCLMTASLSEAPIVIPNREYKIRYESSVAVGGYYLWEFDINGKLVKQTQLSISSRVQSIITQPTTVKVIVQWNFANNASTSNIVSVDLSLYYTPEEGGEGYDQHYDYEAPKTYNTGEETLRSAGSVKDTKAPDGTIARRVGSYTFTGDETIYGGTNGQFNTPALASLIASPDTNAKAANVAFAGLAVYRYNAYGDYDNGIYVATDGTVAFYVSSVTSNAEAKAFLTGKTIYYELAEPTTEQGTSFPENIEIDDYGMMYWLDADGNLASVPQGAKFFYPVDYKGYLDDVYSRTNGEAGDLVIQSELAAGLEPKADIEALEKGNVIPLLANNLDTKVVQNDVDAYNFRTSGGSLEIGDTCKVGAIVGGSLWWNNLAYYDSNQHDSTWSVSINSTTREVTFSCNNTNGASATDCALLLSNKYRPYMKANDKILVEWDNDIVGSQYIIFNTGSGYVLPSATKRYEFITVSDPANVILFIIRCAAGGSIAECKVRVKVHNLTTILGSTIADYINTLESGTAGAGLAWFHRYFPKGKFYPYCTPTPVHVQTKGKKYVGFNRLKDVISVNATNVSSTTVTLQNPIDALGQVITLSAKTTAEVPFAILYDENGIYITEFYVRTAAAGGRVYGYSPSAIPKGKLIKSIKFFYNGSLATSGSFKYEDVCINFHYDGERDGEFEPYEENNYELDPIELLGIPNIDAQGNLYFEGNRYLSDGNVEEEYDVVLISELTIIKVSNNRFASNSKNAVIDKPSSDSQKGVLFCTAFANNKAGDVYDNVAPMICAVNSNGSLIFFVSETYYENHTADQFASDYGNVALIFKKATPTTSEATPFQETQKVDNWGTEEFLTPDGDTRPVEVPVGHDTDYLLDIKSKVEIAPDLPSSDGTYVCKVESGTAEYIPLGDWLVANGYSQASVLASKDALGGTLRQLLAVSKSIDFGNTAYVDLGELTWSYTSSGNVRFKASLSDGKELTLNIISTNGLIPVTSQSALGSTNHSVLITGGEIQIKWTELQDADAFKAAMKGILLAYEKASS